MLSKFSKFSRRHASIGFVGLGNMGGPMAKNLAVKGGHDLTVFDVSQDRIDWLKSEASGKITSVACPADIAAGNKIIVTMLPSNPHVLEVYTNPKTGILATAQSNSMFLDSSTIDPNVARQVATKVNESNSSNIYLDAPVSGGVTAAAAGTLTFMVGNDSESQFSNAKEILQHMGANVVSLTGVGNGQVAKICNNMMLGISMIGVSETMALGKKLGIDQKQLAGIMNISSARCWSSDTYNPVPGIIPGVPSNNQWNGGFGAALMLKDLGLAQDAANTVGVDTALGKHAQDIYTTVCDAGYAGRDFGSVYHYLVDGDAKKLD